MMPSLFPRRRNFARTSSCIRLKHMAINDKPSKTYSAQIINLPSACVDVIDFPGTRSPRKYKQIFFDVSIKNHT